MGRKLTDEEKALLAEQLEEERQLRAWMHRMFGVAATVLVLVAIGVAIWRMDAMFGQTFGISTGEALGIGATTIPWVLLILGLGVLFSMGTTRIAMGIEWVFKRIAGKK